MKLFSILSVGTLVAAGATDEKKVPPRHPLQRLNRLNDFITELMRMHGDNSPMTPSKRNRWVKKFGDTSFRMETAFRRQTKKCGFYNADNVAGHGAHTSSDGAGNQEAVVSTSFNHGGYDGGNGDDGRPVLTQEHINYQGGKNRKRRSLGEDFGDGLDRYNRDDPCIGIRNIIQGYRKWSDRYLGLCDGQDNYQHHRRRALKWYLILTGPKGFQCPTPPPLGFVVTTGPSDDAAGDVASDESNQLTLDSQTTYGVDCSVRPKPKECKKKN